MESICNKIHCCFDFFLFLFSIMKTFARKGLFLFNPICSIWFLMVFTIVNYGLNKQPFQSELGHPLTTSSILHYIHLRGNEDDI